MVYLHISEVPCIFYWLLLIQSYEVHVVVCSLEENRGVVVEVEIEEGDVLGIFVVEKV